MEIETSKVLNLIKVIIWNMSYALDAKSPNIGDILLTWGLIRRLNTDLKKKLEITIFCSNNKDAILPKDSNLKIVKYKPRNFFNIIKAISNCHIFIIGGGELLSDRSHALYSIFNLIPTFIAKLFCKKIMGYAISVDEPAYIFTPAIILAKLIFGKKEKITVRDFKSLKSISQLKLKSRTIFTTDAGFGLLLDESFKKFVNKPLKRNIIVIAPRLPFFSIKSNRWNPLDRFLPLGVRVKRGHVNRSYFKMRGNFLEDMAKIIKYLHSKHGFTCILLPMYSGEFSYGDKVLCREIMNLVTKEIAVKIFENTHNPIDVLKLVKSAKLLIGLPLHSLILSIMVGTPFIGISYHPKINRFLKSVGLDNYFINIGKLEHWRNKFNIKTLFNKIEEVLSNSTIITKKLNNKLKELKEKEKINLNILKKL